MTPVRSFLVVLLAVGGLAPPTALSQPYRLVCSYFEEDRAAVYRMDETSTVSLEMNLKVGYDAQQVTASPDGRSFLIAQYGGVSGNPPAADTVPWFFIDSTGTIHRGETGPWPIMPTEYSNSGLLAFCSIQPCKSYDVLHSARRVEETGYSVPYPWEVGAHPDNCSYSAPFHGVVWFAGLSDFVYGVPTDNRGKFGPVTERFYFGDKGSNRDMDISPDGWFVTVLGIEDPQLAVIGIRPNGTFYSVQNLLLPFRDFGDLYRLRYTPDGRFLLVVSSHYQHFLTSFEVDSLTGELTEVDHADSLAGMGGYTIDALAISPDSRYAVFPNGVFTGGTQMTFMVYRIESDGHLTRITQARNDFPGYVSDMDFIPPYQEPITAASTGWMLYQ